MAKNYSNMNNSNKNTNNSISTNNISQQTNSEVKVAYNNTVTNVVNKEEKKTTTTPKVPKQKTSSYSGNVKEYWPQILQDLKQNGKIVLYTNLLNTQAREINDMTVGIEFPNGLTSFGKTVLEKQENIKELTNLVSMASGKPMNIKYITNVGNVNQVSEEKNIGDLAKESDIPFNVIE